MTLRDALATALTNQYAEIWTDGGPWLTTAKTAGLLADHALADPAFRAALVEAVGEALTSEGHDEGLHFWCKPHPDCGLYDSGEPFAAALLDRMLGDET